MAADTPNLVWADEEASPAAEGSIESNVLIFKRIGLSVRAIFCAIQPDKTTVRRKMLSLACDTP